VHAVFPIVAALLASLAIYLVGFTFIVAKPLTVGFIREAFELKNGYAHSLAGTRVLIVAGSNGLFSHRCAAMDPILGRCVNASITAELGLGYLLEFARRIAAPGDIIVMPLEHTLYDNTRDDIAKGLVHPYRVSYDRATLDQLRPPQIVRALFQFDLRYLAGALPEMTLAAAGIERRFNRSNLTRQGDLVGQTAELGAAYRDAIRSQAFLLPRADAFTISEPVRRTLGGFLDWAGLNRIRVIGTLATTFDDRPVDEDIVRRLGELFRTYGQDFAVLPNRSQYPRSCFFDTQFHLTEPCQIEHSRSLARLLVPILRRSQ
jgi:hypothetical protein